MMPTFGAIDIGANSVRLKVARLTRHRLQLLHEDREVTRLGESVFRTGALSTDAMAHTVKVLQRFRRTLQGYGAESVRVVATSPLRDARNTAAFLEWVKATTGWRVEVVSGLEEGRLIHLAVVTHQRGLADRLLLLDLGGGSCEVTLSEHGEIRRIFSLQLGAVRLTQQFLQHDPPKRKELEQLQKYIHEELATVEKQLAAGRIQMTVATSGTAAALAGVHQRRSNPTGGSVPAADLARQIKFLARLTREQRAAIPGIGIRRAEIIVAGAMVYGEVLQRLELPSFHYSALGLRDGLLAQMSADYDRDTRFRKQIDAERENALVNLANHYRVDLKFAGQVRHLALELFAGLKTAHQLPAEYEEWLSAAAMLHEVGAYINLTGNRRHSYYIICHSELFGYTVHQRNLIAAIARYVGKSRPGSESRPLRPLSPEEAIHVQRAVILLRLARALNFSRRGAVQKIALRVFGNRVQLKLTPGRGSADLERWALNKECRYFREVFGRELVVAVS